ncbi:MULTISPECIES: YbaN family protein [unclassified Neorhizobium]|uniref:YbaN family protein n=1 Tax=unclassified Neorhizobium TaxID=2629175 RepID=UPI001FF13BE8|nr:MULTISPECIES: YbaN family protein [unclassified Neorhizobium]MCJ9671243.1 YbaN family protein [Neorhizobium sp. SHOUNA12B]MCJ9747606.1 YbaN family protein [Neorhizobium sp. SHOUNA12A]
MRLLFLALGWLFVAIGIVGAFLPVLPTTPFLLLAVACFARSSPRLEAWLLEHPKFGPSLRSWREKGAIARKAKVAAISLMAVSYAVFWFGTSPPLWRAALVAAVMLGSATFIVTRPDT